MSLQLTKEMFFQRGTRIKTEPRIAETFQHNFYDNKRRAKIKNVRLSLGTQFDKFDLESKLQPHDKKEAEHEKEEVSQQKKSIFLKKLPELNLENKQLQKQVKQVTKQVRQATVKGKKKQVVLTSILDILKPNSNWHSNGGMTRKFASRLLSDWKVQTEPKQYRNEFSEEISHYSSTKHYRTPKILENELMKFKNSNNIVRRKITSEDKYRQKEQKVQKQSKELNEGNKANQDLQKIEIITFSNKFPLFKKDSLGGK